MKNYVIEFNGSGKVCEGHFDNDIDAQFWVETVLGLGPDDVVINGEWEENGKNDEGQTCYRMLFWDNYNDSINDSGAKSICQLCKIDD